jgi:bifunctional enzyme CysN/CysC
MTARPDPNSFDSFLRRHEQKDLLRFIACGSVDHGKSTLVGRLLYEAGLVFEDQLTSLAIDSRKHGTVGDDLDFALVLDGLAAEREQKITIDVAYRFFTTERRKFIVSDAPGHERYTRNMATGASNADLALVVVNAGAGLTRQTRRHCWIVATLGVRRLVVAINKMDLVGWSQDSFRAIEADFCDFARDLEIDEIVCIPTAARNGDNIVHRSNNMPWYRGETLLEHLEHVQIASPTAGTFRMPIQWVNRPNADFRGYSGLIASGEVFAGTAVQILPSGETTRIERIVTSDGDLARASAGQAVTLTLTEDVDASRGDMIAAIEHAPSVTDVLSARIIWVDRNPLVSGRTYLLKLATCTVKAAVAPRLSAVDLDNRTAIAVEQLVLNDVGHCMLLLDRHIAVDPYARCRDTGSFILIDRETCETVGMGMVEASPS